MGKLNLARFRAGYKANLVSRRRTSFAWVPSGMLYRIKCDCMSKLELNRRGWLKLSLTSALASSCLRGRSAPSACAPAIPGITRPQTVDPAPPHPVTRQNGNHNQSPMPNVGFSHIFHFTGKVARCIGFHGMGTDNHGNRLAWGLRHRLQLHGWRILGRAPASARHFRSYLIHGL